MKAKRAWICTPERDYSLSEAEDIREPVIVLKEPNCWEYEKIVPIVYFEVEE